MNRRGEITRWGNRVMAPNSAVNRIHRKEREVRAVGGSGVGLPSKNRP